MSVGEVHGGSSRYIPLYLALSYLKKDSESVAMAVFDSPFASLKELALEVGK